MSESRSPVWMSSALTTLLLGSTLLPGCHAAPAATNAAISQSAESDCRKSGSATLTANTADGPDFGICFVDLTSLDGRIVGGAALVHLHNVDSACPLSDQNDAAILELNGSVITRSTSTSSTDCREFEFVFADSFRKTLGGPNGILFTIGPFSFRIEGDALTAARSPGRYEFDKP